MYRKYRLTTLLSLPRSSRLFATIPDMIINIQDTKNQKYVFLTDIVHKTKAKQIYSRFTKGADVRDAFEYSAKNDPRFATIEKKCAIRLDYLVNYLKTGNTLIDNEIPKVSYDKTIPFEDLQALGKAKEIKDRQVSGCSDAAEISNEQEISATSNSQAVDMSDQDIKEGVEAMLDHMQQCKDDAVYMNRVIQDDVDDALSTAAEENVSLEEIRLSTSISYHPCMYNICLFKVSDFKRLYGEEMLANAVVDPNNVPPDDHFIFKIGRTINIHKRLQQHFKTYKEGSGATIFKLLHTWPFHGADLSSVEKSFQDTIHERGLHFKFKNFTELYCCSDKVLKELQKLFQQTCSEYVTSIAIRELRIKLEQSALREGQLELDLRESKAREEQAFVREQTTRSDLEESKQLLRKEVSRLEKELSDLKGENLQQCKELEEKNTKIRSLQSENQELIDRVEQSEKQNAETKELLDQASNLIDQQDAVIDQKDADINELIALLRSHCSIPSRFLNRD